MNILTSIIGSRKALKLSSREMECVEDGMLWGLTCLGAIAPQPIRRWVAERQNLLSSFQDFFPPRQQTLTQALWSHLGLVGTPGQSNAQTPLNAGLDVGARIIVLAEQRTPVWWVGTAKAPQMLALILGLGAVFNPNPIEPPRALGAPQLLSPAEMGYALALIAEYSGTEPKGVLKTTPAAVRDGYLSGKAALSRDIDLRHDLQVLTSEYDRGVGRLQN